jgi:AbrB family looped-hinge helix DNA binding protein
MGAREVLTVSAKWQVVVPQAIRIELGITPGSEVEVHREGSGVMIRLKHARPVSKLADGFGMLKYVGKSNWKISILVWKCVNTRQRQNDCC